MTAVGAVLGYAIAYRTKDGGVELDYIGSLYPTAEAVVASLREDEEAMRSNEIVVAVHEVTP